VGRSDLRDEVGNELCGVRCAEAGDGIPAHRRVVAIVSARDVVEVRLVGGDVVRKPIKRGVDKAEVVAGYLVSHRNETRPLRSARARSADDVPAGAARTRAAAAGLTALEVRLAQVDENAGPRARLIADVRDAAHVRGLFGRAGGRADERAARRKPVLIVGPGEVEALAAARADPPQ